MKQHEKLRMLREEGFTFVRGVRHGSMYRNAFGDVMILARPGSKDTRADKNWAQEIKRIKRKREMATV